jgi:hypothetical protein
MKTSKKGSTDYVDHPHSDRVVQRPTINAEEIKGYLRHYIHNLQTLHDKLDDRSDIPLSPQDKSDLRNAMAASWVTDIQAEQRMFFRNGSIEDVIASTESLVSMLEQLS